MNKTILSVAMILMVTVFFGQTNYEFSSFNEAYQPLNNATSLNNGEIFDDPVYTIPLGFTFSTINNSFDTIYFPENGLGGELTSTLNFDTGFTSYFIPLGQDIISRVNAIGESISKISYFLEGSSPNQILKIEWNNVGFYDDGTTLDFMNFQIWLYEKNNVLEYRYGPSSINNPDDSFEGETGPVVAFAPYFDNENGVFVDDGYILSGNPSNPEVLVFSDDDEADGALNGSIPNGTVYRFGTILSTNDKDFIKVNLLPNPTEGVFNVITNEQVNNIVIYNYLGEKIKVVKNSINVVNISELPSGIYFVNINTDQSKVTKRIIKQ